MLRLATLDDFDIIYSIYMEESVNPFLSFEAMPSAEFRPLFEEFMRTREVYVYEYEGQIAAAMNVTRGQWRMAMSPHWAALQCTQTYTAKGSGRHFSPTC